MTSVLKKSKGSKGKSESMQEDLPARWGEDSRGEKTEDVAKLVRYIDDSIVGKGNSFCGPYGRRKVVYCDYSGSGRSLSWLEEHVAQSVLPTHATQCTAFSYTSGQSELYKSESKAVIRSAVNACPEDVVIVGGALPRLLRSLTLARVAVFVSSRETARQLAPWTECGAEIIKVPETKEGFIDLNNLEQRLIQNTGSGKRLIGFFPAASKLTGVLADDVATTILLHQYGAWAFWDYTLVAPSAAVNMNPTIPGLDEQMVKKDALFFNCEKFVGGVQGPYVAVVKKHVFESSPVFEADVDALSEKVEDWRSVDGVRAALVLQLRDSVGLANIAERQDSITRQVLSHIKNIPELILLGSESPNGRRLPIFSLMVKHPRGTFLHHNFVCAILNDVFGIQARGGLNSNLNYGQDILGIDEKLLKEYEKLLDVEAQKVIAHTRKISDAKSPDIPIYNEHLRPGFCRVSLPFFMSEGELAFVLEALKMVATEGWKILPQYVVNPKTGQWRHHSCSTLKDRKSLYSVRFHDGKMTANERRISGPGIFPQTYTECLQTARNLFNRARKLAMKCSTAEPEVSFNPRIDYLRWFMLPKEAHELLLGRSANVKHIVPFDPSGYTGARKSLLFSRSHITSSPILGSSPRHFSLSALDDCQVFRLKQNQKFYSRESSVKEIHREETSPKSPPATNPVQFAIGDSVSPVHLDPRAKSMPLLVRSRCYSLGSDSPLIKFSIQNTMKEASPSSINETTASSFCNCGSQTDLQSLDDPMMSPGRMYPYSTQSSASISDCSQAGRASPTTSLTSHNSDDIHAYVKEMTKEIATEIKSEIREVISRVDDILENSEAIDQSNLSINSISSQSDRNSVSVIDVAEYLMGMSREMASEVKHEIREMVSQVDEMISPEYTGYGSRKNSPPQSARRRIGSGTELGLELNRQAATLKKCPTSPVLSGIYDDADRLCKASNAKRSPMHESSGPNSLSFNSSETSTPETIIQMVTSSSHGSPTVAKSSSSNKLSDDEICADLSCRQCCIKKTTGSSQDSGINLSFGEADSYLDFVKWRTSSDPLTNKAKKLQGRLRMCHKYEKSEVPDIIEGVPVCASEHKRQYTKFDSSNDGGRVNFQIPDESEKHSNRVTTCDWKRNSNSSSSCSERSSRSSGYSTDSRPSREEPEEPDEPECQLLKHECWDEERDDSSTDSLTDFTIDDEGKWHCPPKTIWKSCVEAIHEYGMVRAGDKVLVCLSGSRESIALLHTMHQYQFYGRAKGLHFSIGALFVHEPQSEVDPLHLMAYCRSLGVRFLYQDRHDDTDSRRHSTSVVPRWGTHLVRRGAYRAAASHAYSTLAVAQTLDAAARAFLASAMRRHALAAHKAHVTLREHNLRVIRPFIYVRERDLAAFGRALLPEFRGAAGRGEGSPEHSDDGECKPSSPSKTHKDYSFSSDEFASARHILAAQEARYPDLFASLKSALHPLISCRDIEQDLKEHRHRKKSVIQMKNGAPVYDSEEGTDEEAVP
ncbi:uncharacterized protein LOC105383502 [Plutella xylostella]|uniref:uncharacterized protein LOC105383502 n=1 Tax=Plutella xylostella TaxID=51655 RepID=UPI0020325838|nr:uncharacterized protein LOC105383502 [Plutella xylostella]